MLSLLVSLFASGQQCFISYPYLSILFACFNCIGAKISGVCFSNKSPHPRKPPVLGSSNACVFHAKPSHYFVVFTEVGVNICLTHLPYGDYPVFMHLLIIMSWLLMSIKNLLSPDRMMLSYCSMISWRKCLKAVMVSFGMCPCVLFCIQLWRPSLLVFYSWVFCCLKLGSDEPVFFVACIVDAIVVLFFVSCANQLWQTSSKCTPMFAYLSFCSWDSSSAFEWCTKLFM